MSGFIPWESPGKIPDDITGWPAEFTKRPGLEFVRTPSPLDALWWDHRFGKPYDLTPTDMAETLFAGLPAADHAYAYEYIDHKDESFLLSARGNRGDVEIWGGGVALELRKDTLLWDKVESYERGHGVGKKMAGNLLACAKRFKLPYIEVNTENVCSHLWADAGFYPHDAVWLALRLDLWRRFLEVRPHASQRSLEILEKIITATGGSSNPRLIQAIARLPDLVPARHTRDPRSDGSARLGQDMLVGLNWSGKLDVSVAANEERLAEWLKS